MRMFIRCAGMFSPAKAGEHSPRSGCHAQRQSCLSVRSVVFPKRPVTCVRNTH